MLATEDNRSQYRGKRETATTEEMASELTAVEMKMTSLIEHCSIFNADQDFVKTILPNWQERC